MTKSFVHKTFYSILDFINTYGLHVKTYGEAIAITKSNSLFKLTRQDYEQAEFKVSNDRYYKPSAWKEYHMIITPVKKSLNPASENIKIETQYYSKHKLVPPTKSPGAINVPHVDLEGLLYRIHHHNWDYDTILKTLLSQQFNFVRGGMKHIVLDQDVLILQNQVSNSIPAYLSVKIKEDQKTLTLDMRLS